ncbi:MAG: transporter substrate-binding domain-containing protein [Gammaproteobacteria bacterium]|nr:transporter substrate-binding domain-containing protein [Gammaproteobacteria bacterium]MDH5800906.1 transporter substrate-binding domain-containing protein [Gammaproteobacteria bacterium]
MNRMVKVPWQLLALLVFLSLVFLSLLSCGDPSQQPSASDAAENIRVLDLDSDDNYIEKGDFDTLQQRGQIRVVMPRFGNQDGFLPRQGSPLNVDIELLHRFAEREKLNVVWVFVDSFELTGQALLQGKADIIAANMTVTPERKKQWLFTVPVAIVKEQLIGSSGARISKPSELTGKQVAVKKTSSFWDTAQALKRANSKVSIEEIETGAQTDSILDDIAQSKNRYTILDSNIAAHVLSYRDDLAIAFDVSGERAIAWAVRPQAATLKQKLDQFLSQEKLTQKTQSVYTADFTEIKNRKVLRVLTRNSAATYFLWRGELVGFDYELVQRFAQQHGLRLEVVVPPSRELLLPWLKQGKGDLISASLTIDPAWAAQGVSASRKINQVSEMLVSRSDDPLGQVKGLHGRTVVVRGSSSYWKTLQKLQQQLQQQGLKFKLKKAPETLETEEIIAKVAQGEYDLTVADSHILDIELTWREDIKGAFTLGQPVDHAWVVRSEDQLLLEEINRFIKKEYRGVFYNMTRNKYFKKPHAIAKRLQQRVDGGNGAALSPYDELMQKYAKQYQLDWRLLVSQMYQESRFDPNAKSWVGAKGLMQVMPRTARELGISQLEVPENGIKAGVKYMNWLMDRFEHELPVKDRMWFALAAYNAGLGHVNDARRLARKKGWKSNRWFGHVEKAMLLLSKRKYAQQAAHGYVRGQEPVNYVRSIRDRYQAYLRLTTDRTAFLGYHHLSK